MVTVTFYRGASIAHIIAMELLYSDSHHAIDYLSKRFGSERVERARQESDPELKCQVLCEDFTRFEVCEVEV